MNIQHTRNIHNGDQFNSLIPAPKNKKVFLGSGDTFTSLSEMKKIILSTLDETEKLAKQLSGKTVPETVKNIKDFIYWHIQYRQDETDQLLHSPAHTWFVRKAGVDCKSYSIFASSILTNLKIANSLRQIKQVTFNPEYFTHVYVYLPAHDLVIDGTVKYDHEPLYAEKYDEPVLHSGLKGLNQLAYNSWCNRRNNNSNFNNNGNSIAARGGGNSVRGARLPFVTVADLLTEDRKANNVKIIKDADGIVSDSGFRLRLAKAKAKARKRKILLTDV